MSNYQDWVLTRAEEAANKLHDLVKEGGITIEAAVAIGEARALIKLLSDTVKSYE